jgi:serine/threonine protein kinase
MIGQTVSHYRILGKLGGGGMGVVYEAEDIRLGRRVALKFIPDNLIGDPKSLERFEREARAASQLNHPNICTIHEIEDNNGHPFIVMEKLEGESLKQMIQGKALDTDTILDVGVQVADALTASHAKGIIHRDIKPANIFLTPSGQAKVLDFGLAKLTTEAKLATSTDTGIEDSLTAVGVIPGTAVYMAPEQARSEPLDPRSDLFSFGVVLYEMATGKKPFSGTNIVTTLDAVLHQKPAPPLTLNPSLPPELQNIIGRAMEKDKTKRYQNAGEMRADLQHLKKETESGLTRTGAKVVQPLRVASSTFKNSSKMQTYLLLAMTGLLLAVLGSVGAWWFKHRRLPPPPQVAKGTVAVLPLQNMTNDGNLEYLRFALADEIASVLTYNQGLDVRPTGSTRKYSNADVDLQQAGREQHVANVITGHYMRQGNKIMVVLQSVDVNSNAVSWQSPQITAPSQDFIGLQDALSKEVRSGLLPKLGGGNEFLETSTRPKSQEAYDLYLRSIAVPHDEKPNKEAILMLERAVGMDPSYAAPWQALGIRYYYDSSYSSGGEEAFQKSNASYERALALDPNLVFAAGNLITNRVERGELEAAHQQALALVKKRPQSAQAHFALSYVYRYAGMLGDAMHECDEALRLDPGNFMFRSCARAFLYSGDTRRAREFVHLDAGSEWANAETVGILLRESKLKEAHDAVGRMPGAVQYHRDLLEAVVGLKPSSELDRIAQEDAATVAGDDPERSYAQGAVLAFAGKKEAAVHMIRMAIEQNYCAYSALENDPLLEKLKSTSEFADLLRTARFCQQPILAASGTSAK